MEKYCCGEREDRQGLRTSDGGESLGGVMEGAFEDLATGEKVGPKIHFTLPRELRDGVVDPGVFAVIKVSRIGLFVPRADPRPVALTED